MTCIACGSTLRDGARACLSCGEIVRASPAASTRPSDPRALGLPAWFGLEERARRPAVIRTGRLPRLMAALVDVIIYSVATAAIDLAFFRDRLQVSATNPDFEPDWLLWGVSITLAFVYLVGFPFTPLRGTPGKWMFGLHVVESDGAPLTLDLAFKRSLWQMVFLVIIFPLAAIFALFGVIAVAIAFIILIGDGGSPWDSLAGTCVVD